MMENDRITDPYTYVTNHARTTRLVHGITDASTDTGVRRSEQEIVMEPSYVCEPIFHLPHIVAVECQCRARGYK